LLLYSSHLSLGVPNGSVIYFINSVALRLKPLQLLAMQLKEMHFLPIQMKTLMKMQIK
jgi:hypothetical protein